jgi:D-glycero-alpha-D-manno-heptose-7-phosphate kinase
MVISQTPLRISIGGGGTDWPDYYLKYGSVVISAAINKYIYVIVKERFDNNIGAYYFKSETVSKIEELKHDLIRECAIASGLRNGFDVSILTDIPADGSGLGSSSSLTVGLLLAFHTYNNKSISNKELAELACKVEIEILKKPIGKQDQYAAAFGGLNAIKFGKSGEINIVPMWSRKQQTVIEENLLLYFTNITRQADLILAEQKENIEKNIKELHAIKEIALELYDDLENNNLVDKIGEALNKNWMFKQKLATNISNDEIMTAWKLAMGNGASGGKITGAGGGGFLLLYVRKANQDTLRKAMNNYFEFPFRFERRGSRIILDLPTQRIK